MEINFQILGNKDMAGCGTLIGALATTLNSSVNVAIYWAQNDEFRQVALRLMRRIFCKNQIETLQTNGIWTSKVTIKRIESSP